MANNDAEKFIVFVNYDDPRWRTIQHGSYARVNVDLGPEHFLIGGHGTREVVMEYVIFDDNYEPTAREVIAEISRRGLRLPDRAETESFLDQHPEAGQLGPTIGLCGSITARGEESDIAFIDVFGGGWRTMEFVWLDDCWDVGCCFLAVRPV